MDAGNMISEGYFSDSSDDDFVDAADYSRDSSDSEDVGESFADYSSSSSEDHSSNSSEDQVSDSDFYGGYIEELSRNSSEDHVSDSGFCGGYVEELGSKPEEPGSDPEEPSSNSSSFEQLYRCYPVSVLNKEHLEKGDKIIMPLSALDRLLSNLQINYPMLFELSNPGNSGRVAHCGVLEFVADEGLTFLPYWMMKKLLLQDGDLVQVKNKSLVKGTYMKLQPHTMEFLDVSDPKDVLETALRSYSCLATGDTFMVPYNNKEYYIDVIETKPSPAICIIDTDCEVDFAPPLDYVEPQKPAVPSTQSKERPAEANKDEEPSEKIPKFIPFTGSARRLDGKPALDQSVAPVSSTEILEQNQQESENGTKGSMPSTSTSAGRPNGKLVFGKIGSNANRPTNETPKVAAEKSSQEQSQKAETPKLQAFTGKKYTLQG
ncbi:unnamed protein product [Malus baccata var. baccata]